MGVRRTATQGLARWTGATRVPGTKKGVRRVKGAIGDVLPFALVVTISPINIIAAIVLLFSKRPVVNAASYVVGFVVGVAAMLGALVAIAGTVDLAAGPGRPRARGHSDRPRRCTPRGRDRQVPLRTESGEPASFQVDGRPRNVRTVKSLGLGVLIGALNPKNIAMAIAAALSIASVGLTGGQQVVVVVVYVVLAVLGVAAPVVVASCSATALNLCSPAGKRARAEQPGGHGRAVPRVLRGPRRQGHRRGLTFPSAAPTARAQGRVLTW